MAIHNIFSLRGAAGAAGAVAAVAAAVIVFKAVKAVNEHLSETTAASAGKKDGTVDDSSATAAAGDEVGIIPADTAPAVDVGKVESTVEGPVTTFIAVRGDDIILALDNKPASSVTSVDTNKDLTDNMATGVIFSSGCYNGDVGSDTICFKPGNENYVLSSRHGRVCSAG